jgi:hypothetical protein
MCLANATEPVPSTAAALAMRRSRQYTLGLELIVEVRVKWPT